MYESGTILKLKVPESTDETIYPYDRVEVVGQSPVHYATASGSPWAGADATTFILKPLSDFAPTVDKPEGLLREIYEVESYPTDPVTGEPLKPENNPRNQPSPEQALAAAAKEQPRAKPRKATPSRQDNARSPEQVLRG